MATWFSRLTLNQRLAALALVLGAVALVAAPYRGTTVTLDTRALAADMATGADQVEPRDLAAWILGGRADHRLIDIRPADAFGAFSIPTSENIPVAGLLEAGLARSEKLLVVGDDGMQSAQAWLLLRANGYRSTYLLRGGLAAWKEQVVSPVLAENPTPEQKTENDKLTAIAAYFGGQPRVASGAVASGFSRTGEPAAVTAPPSVAPPAAPKAAPRPAPRKKKEGC
jgi:rhodanese-related sulfurtransferase